MKFSVFQVSRKGGRRDNEDRMGYSYTRESAVLVLADGMGGHPKGEVASQLALQAIITLFQKTAQPKLPDVAEFLVAAVMAAHRQILHYAADKAMLDSPRTTLVVAVVQSGSVTWTHCGDSRLYLVRESALLVRTRDHSFVEQNQLSAPDANMPARQNRNVLFTCLGSPTKPVFSVSAPLALQQDDKVMLCSDGLWSSLNDDEIVFELSQKPVDTAVPDLVEKALNKAGASSDNVTCLALAWETPDTFQHTRGGSTIETINAGLFESTVQAGLQDTGADDLDDAAIERSIAEINQAIRRTAEKKS
jgi:serine/threonine protein phosphatase PrpC